MKVAASRRSIRRKNLNIDQRKIERARRILGTVTETETVDRALDLVVFRSEILRSLDRAKGRGGIEPID